MWNSNRRQRNSGPNEKTLGSPGTAALGISVGASDVSMSIPTFNGSASIERFENMQLLGKDFSDRLEDLQGQTLPIILQDLVKQLILLGKISTENLR